MLCEESAESTKVTFFSNPERGPKGPSFQDSEEPLRAESWWRVGGSRTSRQVPARVEEIPEESA